MQPRPTLKENAELKKVIHLSTHSLLYKKQPLIFFSNFYDPENDGFLEASEIVQLKLNSDLVVLSSCSSGLGKIDESEGIIGMTKAFFDAGTKSIIVSLWEVNDKYTSKLMTMFYQKLSEGFDKSEALRQAKVEFIKTQSPNPYFWAAFVLSGNTSKLKLRIAFSIFVLHPSCIIINFDCNFCLYIQQKKKAITNFLISSCKYFFHISFNHQLHQITEFSFGFPPQEFICFRWITY